MKRSIALFALAAFLAAGCSATQPGGGAGGQISPAQQCQLIQTLSATAQTGVLLAKIKDETARIAVNAALAGVSAGAADYCDAVARGEAVDGLATFLAAFNASLLDLNTQLRNAQAIAAAAPKPEPVPRL